MTGLFPEGPLPAARSPLKGVGPQALSALNSFGIAARAHAWWSFTQWPQLPGLIHALQRVPEAPTPFIWGGGTNLLVLGDVAQPIVQVGLVGKKIVSDIGTIVLVEAAAGESWDGLVRWSLDQGLAGLENLALIPGTVGAAPVQNIGAYGVELSDVFDSLLAVHLRQGTLHRFDRAECAFGYRDSFFKHDTGREWLIVSVRFKLRRDGPSCLDYGDLRAALKHRPEPSPQDVAAAVSAIRRAKLPDPTVLGNAGSFFKNPLIPNRHAERLRAQYPTLPCWPIPPSQAKVSAAWMIEHLGWKGQRAGDAGVHAQHALVLVNHGQASGADIWQLAQRIIESVHTHFGITLEPEPVSVGTLPSKHPPPEPGPI